MRKYLLIVLILSILIPIMTGCCVPGDNACYRAWYFLEPVQDKPGVYTGSLDLWIEEAFGKESGWHEWWTRGSQNQANSDLVSNRGNTDEVYQIAERIKNIEAD